MKRVAKTPLILYGLTMVLWLTGALLAGAQSGPAMTFKLTNNTKGKFRDQQIYWAILGRSGDRWVHVERDGRVVPMSVADNTAKGHLKKNGQDYANYFHPLSEVATVPVPKLGSSRMFISLGSPMYLKVMDDGYAGADLNNPTDPNARVIFDFVEFTIDARGFHGNTTQVDAFGIPLLLELTDRSGEVRRAGITESRSALFKAFKRETPREFHSCVRAPYRIVSPCVGDFGKGRPHERYFDGYIEKAWSKSGPKPTTQEAFLGTGMLAKQPPLCAAINRHVLENPADWNNPKKYYLEGPANFYAKFWHDHSINGKAYGFCYDDVNAQDTLIEAAHPRELNVVIGWD